MEEEDGNIRSSCCWPRRGARPLGLCRISIVNHIPQAITPRRSCSAMRPGEKDYYLTSDENDGGA